MQGFGSEVKMWYKILGISLEDGMWLVAEQESG
jgi:hypothetical protein